jgi:hypothetical protein
MLLGELHWKFPFSIEWVYLAGIKSFAENIN